MKRRGFTLVELLAVIAILAILVIIALPNVMNLFNRAKQNAFETEIKEVFKTAEQQWIADSMFNTRERVYAKTRESNCANTLDMTGRGELEYYIKLDKSGNVVTYKATDGSYQYSYSGTGLKIEDISNVIQISKIDDEDQIINISCEIENNQSELNQSSVPEFITLSSNGFKGTDSEIDFRGGYWYTIGPEEEFVSTIENGIYMVSSTANDLNPIYYYRGAVKNNNLLYDNKCWKIIRTTSTGGLKLIYNGLPNGGNCGTNTSISQSSASIGNYAYNSTNSNNVNYRTSTIKPIIENWFSNVDTSLLENVNFCIDLDVSSSSNGSTFYMPGDRTGNATPSLACSSSNTYVSKVGLISSDEIIYAGADIHNNVTFYLYANYGSHTRFWSISPYSNEEVLIANYVTGAGTIGPGLLNASYATRPVISLKPGLNYTGNGTYNNPYIPSNN